MTIPDDAVFTDYKYETYDHNPFLGERDVIGSDDNWGMNAPDWAAPTFGYFDDFLDDDTF